jgi:hypothetical protein
LRPCLRIGAGKRSLAGTGRGCGRFWACLCRWVVALGLRVSGAPSPPPPGRSLGRGRNGAADTRLRPAPLTSGVKPGGTSAVRGVSMAFGHRPGGWRGRSPVRGFLVWADACVHRSRDPSSGLTRACSVPGSRLGSRRRASRGSVLYAGRAGDPVGYANDPKRTLSATPSTLIEVVVGVGDRLALGRWRR